MQTAIKLFARHGMHDTSMRAIAENLNISEGTLYNYFPSKQSLLIASISHITDRLASDLRYINKQPISSYRKIHAFSHAFFVFVRKNPEMIGYFFRIYLSNREIFCNEKDCGFSLAENFIEELRYLVHRGIREKAFRHHDFFVAFSAIMGILGSMTFLYAKKQFPHPLDTYSEETAETIYRILRPSHSVGSAGKEADTSAKII